MLPKRRTLWLYLSLFSMLWTPCYAAPDEQHFVYQLRASRADLMSTLTEDEQDCFKQHQAYLKSLKRRGKLVFAGACSDGAFGFVVLRAPSSEKAERLMNDDPVVSSGLLRAEFHPFYPPMLEMTPQRISLEIEQSDGLLPFVTVKLDGRSQRLLLDTGAARSSVSLNPVTSVYASKGKSKSTGASGVSKTVDVICPEEIQLGSQSLRNQQFRRSSSRGVLGMDILGQFIFGVELKAKCLHLVPRLPEGEVRTLRRLDRGHLVLPLELGGVTTEALFDTGADITVVDQQFIDNHREIFHHLGREDGRDGNNRLIQSDRYRCPELTVGSLVLKNVEVVGFRFPAPFRRSLSGVPIILGNNVIAEADWFFDAQNELWVCGQ